MLTDGVGCWFVSLSEEDCRRALVISGISGQLLVRLDWQLNSAVGYGCEFSSLLGHIRYKAAEHGYMLLSRCRTVDYAQPLGRALNYLPCLCRVIEHTSWQIGPVGWELISGQTAKTKVPEQNGIPACFQMVQSNWWGSLLEHCTLLQAATWASINWALVAISSTHFSISMWFPVFQPWSFSQWPLTSVCLSVRWHLSVPP